MKIVFMWCVACWPCSYSWGMVVHIASHSSVIASPAPMQQHVSEHHSFVCPLTPLCMSERLGCTVTVLNLTCTVSRKEKFLISFFNLTLVLGSQNCLG